MASLADDTGAYSKTTIKKPKYQMAEIFTSPAASQLASLAGTHGRIILCNTRRDRDGRPATTATETETTGACRRVARVPFRRGLPETTRHTTTIDATAT